MGVPSSAITETKRLNEIHYLKGKLTTFSSRIYVHSILFALNKNTKHVSVFYQVFIKLLR